MYKLQKRIIILFFAASLICFADCSQAENGKKLSFKKYSNLKLGFTTQSFIKCTSLSPAALKGLIDYAEKQGYYWIELRDPNAELTLEQCKEISEYAKNKNIGIAYALQVGFLDKNFEKTFKKGVKNAAVFDGHKTIRTLEVSKEFIANINKKGWAPNEFQQIVKIADNAAKIAKDNGLRFVVENSCSAIKGDAKTYYGLADLFAQTSPNVGWQFDTANFFTNPRVKITPNEAKTFLDENIKRLSYIHLKTARDRQSLDVLSDNEMDFDVIFSAMSRNNVPYIAIEINALEDIEKVYQNFQKSIDYLKSKGFIVEQ